MRLTAFSDVSLRVLMLLSALEPGQKLSTQKIAEGVGYPPTTMWRKACGLPREHGLFGFDPRSFRRRYALGCGPLCDRRHCSSCY